jgi:hypothetical protein
LPCSSLFSHHRRALLSFSPPATVLYFSLHYCFTLFGHTCARLKSISTGAHYVTRDSKIKCWSIAVLFLGNPTNKTVTRTAYTCELLVANHLDQSLWSTNQKYWDAVRSNLLHSFMEVHNCVATFTSHGELHEIGAEKPISWAKLAHFAFFPINFTVWSHILGPLFWECCHPRSLPYT